MNNVAASRPENRFPPISLSQQIARVFVSSFGSGYCNRVAYFLPVANKGKFKWHDF